MNTLNTTNTMTRTFSTRNEKDLFFKILLFSSVVIVVCAVADMSRPKKQMITFTHQNFDEFSNFDQIHIPSDPQIVAKMITALNPELSKSRIDNIAMKIHQTFSHYKIEPQIILAIIDTESKFNHELVSSTGDLSMAQVNVEVWNKEFSRLNLKLINPERLKVDQAYSLEVMAKILSILKTRYGKSDRRWYARYHSKTKKHKKLYMAKLDTRMKILQASL
jgi:hypothetical protein